MIDGYKLNFLPLISLKSHISAHWNITSISLSRWQLQRFIPWGQRVYLEHSGILGTEPAGRPMPIWESSRHGLPSTRQIRSKASPLTRTRLLINIHQSHVHRCGSLSSKERVSKGMRALFTPCWIISPPPPPPPHLFHSKKQICRLRCVFKRCHFICTSYRRVTFSLSLSKNCTCITWA